MAILGVLLGITMTVLATTLFLLADKTEADKKIFDTVAEEYLRLAERVSILEKRKALLAEAATSAPKPAGVATRKPRWDENAPYKEQA